MDERTFFGYPIRVENSIKAPKVELGSLEDYDGRRHPLVAGKHCYWLGHATHQLAVAKVSGPDPDPEYKGGLLVFYVCRGCLERWRAEGHLDRDDVIVEEL